jgi:hypothetical protein
LAAPTEEEERRIRDTRETLKGWKEREERGK